MEALFAILIVCLSALGLGIGLTMGRRPPHAGCGGAACVEGACCRDCPDHEQKECQ